MPVEKRYEQNIFLSEIKRIRLNTHTQTYIYILYYYILYYLYGFEKKNENI